MPINKGTKLKIRKSIALFLMFILLNQLFAPTVALALTAGPTAPEATNFEPIDTTDMVNPLTGDFTYGLPLLEVPGPEGSYPLALSYHAAVEPNEEASWVGLGWSLNPGAISRNVNGYPDDWKNVNAITRSYWSGGSQTSVGLGITIPIQLPVPGLSASVNFGLQFARDTYKGFGVGYNVGGGIGFGFPLGGGLGIAAGLEGEVGVDPWGHRYSSIGLGGGLSFSHGLGLGNLTGTGELGLNTNFKSMNSGFSAGIGFATPGQDKDGKQVMTNHSLLGASINTGGNGIQLRVGAGSLNLINNANAGKTSTKKTGWHIGLIASLSYTHIRYWSDESATVGANGVLYNHPSLTSINQMDQSDDDNYQLPDISSDNSRNNYIQNGNPSIQAGAIYPNFDDYSVTAQGLGGYMRPYIFQAALYRQNKIDNVNSHANDIYADAKPVPQTVTQKWQFRFMGEFSNYYGQQSPYTSDSYDVSYDFDSNPQYGYHDQSGGNDGQYGYDAATNRLEGTKHIEYFTNAQIASKDAAKRGFINCPDQGQGGFTRNNYDVNQIGGFMITNESGVTYHYALPAYAMNETAYTQLIDQSHGLYSNTVKKNSHYAYTWYLTAITGPDYVSRGTAVGAIDPQNDWGYWVKFDYGQWTNNYQWRTPAQGFNVDLDNGYESWASGTKEVYYLDAIETRSHTAIFEKEIRADAKDVTGMGAAATLDCTQNLNYTASSLRLNNIYLFQNDQLPLTIDAIRNSGTLYQQVNTISGPTCSVAVQPVNGQNVIDRYDINASWAAKCLRKIAFNYNYSLCPGAPNSYDPGGYATYFNQAGQVANGKLTLLSVDMQGKAGMSMTPPTLFQYDLDPSDPNNQDIIACTAPVSTNVTQNGNPLTLYTGTLSTQSNKFRPGDILSFQSGSNTYYCTLVSATDNTNTNFNVRYLNIAPAAAGSNLSATKTKNPPYNKDAYDMWGFYKSDYVAGSANENLSRVTTPVSNRGTDVWSLRKIVSSVGANITINYEGDTYNKSVLSKDRSLIVLDNTKVTRNGAQDYTFHPNTEGIDLTKVYSIGDTINMVYAIQDQPGGGNWLVRSTAPSDAQQNTILGSTVTQINTASGPDHNQGDWINSNPESHIIDAPVVKAIGTDWVEVTTNLGMEEDFYAYFARIEALIGGSPPQYLNFSTGNMTLDVATLLNGGGLRVRDIIIDDLNGSVNKTSYNYSIPGAPSDKQTSSGVTAYEPLVYDADNIGGYPDAIKKAYRGDLARFHSQLLAIAREMPPPGVDYEYVTVTDSSILTTGQRIPMEGKTLYQYEVFRMEMIGMQQYNQESTISENGTTTFAGPNDPAYPLNSRTRNNIAIKDYTSRVGALRRVVTYDNLGNKLTEKITHYLHDDLDNTSFQNQAVTYEPRLLAYNNLGVLQERYGSIRLPVSTVSSSNVPTTYNEMWAMSNRETFPVIQTGVTQIDYKNGTRIDQSNLGFDFYTGAVTKTLSTDSYGNRFISEVTPAYRVYPAMGLMTHDDDNPSSPPPQHKQMISQQAAAYTYSVDAQNNKLGIVTANVQTWTNAAPVIDQIGNATTTGQSNVWRMDATYAWAPSGSSQNNLSPYSSFVDYYATGGSANASWKQTKQVTKYNVYSAGLEAKDINSNYSATRMGFNNTKVLLTGGPAQYNEIAYAGTEDALLATGLFSNNISPGSGTVVADSTQSHTGTHSLMVAAGNTGFTYTLAAAAAKNYSVAVWVKPTASNASQAQLYYQVGSNAAVTPGQTLAKSAAGWYLLEMTVPSTALDGTSNLIVGCKNASSAALYFDDFRFQPTSASTIAYVYDNQTGELTYVLGNNNLFVRYQYDAIGRLVRTYKEVIGKSNVPIARSIVYNYGRFQNTLAFSNVAESGVYQKACTTGSTGTYVTYTVPAGAYTSYSQQDANNKALADVTANGQNYANQNGTCVLDAVINLNNNTADNYQINFSGHGNPSQAFNFNSGSSTIYILPGTYDVIIYPMVNNGNLHGFSYTGQTDQTSTVRASFSNVTVATGTSINALIY